jgi:LacI family transcriptional regulator
VVAYGLKYYGPSRVLTGIERQAAELGYSIFLQLIHEPETNDVEYQLNSLLSHQVDGAIWAIPEIGDNRAWARIKSPHFPVPVMFVGGMGWQPSLPLVGIDNHSIGRLATQHLLDGGARQVGIVTGPLDWWEAQERQRGWRETLLAQGFAADDSLVAVGDWNAESGEKALYQLLIQNPDIDAIFACNDQMALGVLYATHRLGRRIPGDLAVVGVDNNPEAAHFWPPLTTVRQGLQEAGALAVREIDQWLQKTRQSSRHPEITTPRNNLLQPELIIRESSKLPISLGNKIESANRDAS